jgi:hypothetical protein
MESKKLRIILGAGIRKLSDILPDLANKHTMLNGFFFIKEKRCER